MRLNKTLVRSYTIPSVCVAIAVFLLAVNYWFHVSVASSDVVQIGDARVHVTIADTDALRTHGLSGKKELAPDEGMLFVFDHEDRYSFWMKDMLFPIDIVWLSTDGTIVYSADDVQPSTYPKTFQSVAPAQFVLELPAHFMNRHNLKIGDKAILP
jgi:uncharacterized membrane protein (UPF0127 family)